MLKSLESRQHPSPTNIGYWFVSPQMKSSHGQISDEHDDVLQIKGYFYSTFSFEWTKNKKREIKTILSVFYKKQSKNKISLSHPWSWSHMIGSENARRKINLVNPLVHSVCSYL